LGRLLGRRLMEKDKALEEKDRALEEKDKTLEEKDKTLEEKDKALEEKDKALGEKDKTLDAKGIVESFQNLRAATLACLSKRAQLQQFVTTSNATQSKTSEQKSEQDGVFGEQIEPASGSAAGAVLNAMPAGVIDELHGVVQSLCEVSNLDALPQWTNGAEPMDEHCKRVLSIVRECQHHVALMALRAKARAAIKAVPKELQELQELLSTVVEERHHSSAVVALQSLAQFLGDEVSDAVVAAALKSVRNVVEFAGGVATQDASKKVSELLVVQPIATVMMDAVKALLADVIGNSKRESVLHHLRFIPFYALQKQRRAEDVKLSRVRTDRIVDAGFFIAPFGDVSAINRAALSHLLLALESKIKLPTTKDLQNHVDYVARDFAFAMPPFFVLGDVSRIAYHALFYLDAVVIVRYCFQTHLALNRVRGNSVSAQYEIIPFVVDEQVSAAQVDKAIRALLSAAIFNAHRFLQCGNFVREDDFSRTSDVSRLSLRLQSADTAEPESVDFFVVSAFCSDVAHALVLVLRRAADSAFVIAKVYWTDDESSASRETCTAFQADVDVQYAAACDAFSKLADVDATQPAAFARLLFHNAGVRVLVFEHVGSLDVASYVCSLDYVPECEEVSGRIAYLMATRIIPVFMASWRSGYAICDVHPGNLVPRLEMQDGRVQIVDLCLVDLDRVRKLDQPRDGTPTYSELEWGRAGYVCKELGSCALADLCALAICYFNLSKSMKESVVDEEVDYNPMTFDESMGAIRKYLFAGVGELLGDQWKAHGRTMTYAQVEQCILPNWLRWVGAYVHQG